MKKGNGTGTDHADDWDSIGNDVRAFMSQQTHRKPNRKVVLDDEPIPLRDPREGTNFQIVWDKLATDPATSHLIEYINGNPCDPIPTLEAVVAAFHRAGYLHAVIPEQISAVILLCGGQMSRRYNLAADITAEWRRLEFLRTSGAEQAQEARQEGVPFAQSVDVFIKTHMMPEYLVEPVLQRATLYTCTALTSHGKTAVLLYTALCVASGRKVAGKHTTQGRVVWLAGENPDDFAMKIVTACDYWDINPADLDMVVMSGAFDLAGNIEAAIKMAAAGGDTALVVIDTSAAYRFDDDEDSNANAIAWARMLRDFLKMPGRPAVVIATHPTKAADGSSLLPRGGGAFMNEVDGNLTLWADEEQNTTCLHWQGKFRGMTFAPIQFELKPCPHPSWTLRNGEPVQIKLAIPTGEAAPPRRPYNPRGGRPANDDKANLAKKLLAHLLATEGEQGIAPTNLLAVREERWRLEFYSRACVEDDKADTKLKSFRRAAERLLTSEAVAIRDKWVWITHPEVAP